MKLKLINFRCYTEKTFDFGEKGLALLSGPSGQGKSSLLMAINFVLYGTGTKVVTYGKTSCCVELEFDDLKIISDAVDKSIKETEVFLRKEIEKLEINNDLS